MSKARWYVINVYGGFEKKVAGNIMEIVEKNNLQEQIEDVLVPTEQVMEMRRGEKVSTERNVFPGYILVKMVMSDETWHVVSNVSKVSGFLGDRGKASPVPQKEVDRLMSHIQNRAEEKINSTIFEVGEEVVVNSGPFATFNGMVEEIDENKERLKVAVVIFGRSTLVDLDFSQVQKI